MSHENSAHRTVLVVDILLEHVLRQNPCVLTLLLFDIFDIFDISDESLWNYLLRCTE